MSRLVGIREKLNLTQKELAERSGISIRTIQRIEAGTPPKGYTLKTLVKTLNIAEEELLGTEKTSAAGDKIILLPNSW
jgi:transcriptional regulator with XRE-family HTH domain